MADAQRLLISFSTVGPLVPLFYEANRKKKRMRRWGQVMDHFLVHRQRHYYMGGEEPESECFALSWPVTGRYRQFLRTQPHLIDNRNKKELIVAESEIGGRPVLFHFIFMPRPTHRVPLWVVDCRQGLGIGKWMEKDSSNSWMLIRLDKFLDISISLCARRIAFNESWTVTLSTVISLNWSINLLMKEKGNKELTIDGSIH